MRKVRRPKGPFPPWAFCSRTRARGWPRSIFCIRGKKLSNPIAAACGRRWPGAGAVVTVVAILGGIHLRVARLDEQIATLQSSNERAADNLEKSDPLMKTAKLIEDWTQRNVDWLEQFRQIETAIGGTDRLHFVSFNGEVAYMNSLATITASGRAKSRHDVESMNEKLARSGLRPASRRKSRPTRRIATFPEKFELSVEINSLHPKEPAAGPVDRQIDCQDGGKNSEPVPSRPHPFRDGQGDLQIMAFANALRTIFPTDQNSKTATCSPSN